MLPTSRLYSIRDRISIKHIENDTDREKMEYMEQNLLQCHAVNHKSHIRMALDWTQAYVHLVDIQWIANVTLKLEEGNEIYVQWALFSYLHKHTIFH
jgi:hypothetical protein